MASDKDDLEQALQENLRLRRELGAQAGKASRGVAYRLGWALYWVCLVVGVLWVSFFTYEVGMRGDWTEGLPLRPLTAAGLGALLAYGLGRFFRYVLSGE